MTTPDTPTLAGTIRRLDGEATHEPWEASGDHHGSFEVTASNGGRGVFLERTTILARSDMNDPCGEEADAALIIALRNHAAEIADALEAVERARAIHCETGPVEGRYCAHDQYNWPCRTISILDGEK